MENLQISLGAVSTAAAIVLVWIVAITGYIVTIGVKVNGLRHLGELLSFMNTAGETLKHISQTLDRFERMFEKHTNDDKESFQKIYGEIHPLKGRVAVVERDIERIRDKGGAAE